MNNVGPFTFHAAARVDHTTPAYLWQSGAFGAMTDNGAGDLTHNLGADYGIDATEMLPFFAVDGALAASQLTSFGITSASDTAKRVTVLREGAAGAASALTDVNYWMWIFRKVP
ncbi:MAG TPA: hypothetical protein VFX49_11795 [Chloroflexota bacterium]|nr:hypothetical protein [Chloroflexota bacterium]